MGISCRKNYRDRLIKCFCLSCALVILLMTLSIGVLLFKNAFHFFYIISIWNFISGTHWSPTTGGGAFGILPLLSGTFLITSLAMLITVPFGFLSAVYLSYYAPTRQRHFLRSFLEVLSGIPTVVYGFFSIIVVSPLLQSLGKAFGLTLGSETALGAGLVMGMMIMPYMSALSEEALQNIPSYLKEASLAMGATETETIINVILPVALRGLMGAFLLSVSRAIGETMLVVMALGLSSKLTFNPLDTVTTVTIHIVSLLTGDQSFESAGPLSAFALGSTLFLITFGLNIVAFRFVKRSYA